MQHPALECPNCGAQQSGGHETGAPVTCLQCGTKLDRAESQSPPVLQNPLVVAAILGLLLGWLTGLGIPSLYKPIWFSRPPLIPWWSWLLHPAVGILVVWVLTGRRGWRLRSAISALAVVVLCGPVAQRGLAIAMHATRGVWWRNPVVDWHVLWSILASGLTACGPWLAITFDRIMSGPPCRAQSALTTVWHPDHKLLGSWWFTAGASAVWALAAPLALWRHDGLNPRGEAVGRITPNADLVRELMSTSVWCAVLGAVIGVGVVLAVSRFRLGTLSLVAALAGTMAGVYLTPLLWSPGPAWMFSFILLPAALAAVGVGIGSAIEAPAPARSEAYAILAGAAAAAGVFGVVWLSRPELHVKALSLQADQGRDQPKARERLSEITDARSVPALVSSLANEDIDVVKAAAQALAQMGGQDVADRLVTALKHTDPLMRRGAAVGLGSLREPGTVPQLIEALADPESYVVDSAVDALGGMGDARAVDPLIVLLERPDLRTRNVVRALGSLGDARAVAVIVPLLAHEDDGTRRAAVHALGGIGDASAVPSLIAVLTDPEWTVRSGAAQSLGDMGDPRAEEPLIRALADRNIGARQAAVQALHAMGGDLVPPLMEMLRGPDDNDAWWAARQLGAYGGEAAVEPLTAAMEDPSLRPKAQMALAGIDTTGARGVP